jgi:ABC-2 type transport system ATP-binding protein
MTFDDACQVHGGERYRRTRQTGGVPPAIETSDLARRFRGGWALDGLALDVEVGEVVALLGPNGAGKTTTVRLLNGVLEPDRGTCRVLGLDPVADGEALRRRTAVITENAGLDDRLTARQDLSTTAAIRGLRGPAIRARIDDLLGRLGLAERADEVVQGASTGQRKRIALARALVHEPDLLFLDEPTSGLDPAVAREVVDLIASLAAEHGRTVVLCTHVLAEAEELASRVAVLAAGRLQAFGRPADLAAALWPGVEVDLYLGRPAPPELQTRLRARHGVTAVAGSPDGLHLRADDRRAVAAAVAELVAAGEEVAAVVPRTATLTDVYFALQAEARASGEPTSGSGPGLAAEVDR